uniref:Ig-like domain-containing protein n=1 Tax=Esox lucius TaxID=8010 RepID=A0A3P8XHE4_ESOLU
LDVSCGSPELSQPSSMLVKPGESLTITCNVAGYSVSDGSVSYATGWVRKPAGKTMEWISHIWDDGDIYQNDALKNKFSISRDASINSVSLQGNSLKPEDTAVYYCVRRPSQQYKLAADMYKNTDKM